MIDNGKGFGSDHQRQFTKPVQNICYLSFQEQASE